ncbi:hypothetical protein AGMMS50268_18090 [Spirochaetia bacterium]|nr:hypothetical protein AGMMS50268_18090 [Spirochaetia bacterium]
MIENLFTRRELPEKPQGKPVYMADTTGRVLKIVREQDLGEGVFWLVAEEEPVYNVTESEGAKVECNFPKS